MNGPKEKMDRVESDHLNNYPILAKRDLKYGIFKRFFNRQIKNFLRIKRKIITN